MMKYIDKVDKVPPKILIIGGSGLVGRALLEKSGDFGKVYAAYYSTPINVEGVGTFPLDVRDANRVDALFKEIQPDTVLNAAAKRNTSYCEKNPDEAYKVNVGGTKNIVKACKNIKAKLVFISSDLVFDGTKGKYREEDKVNPLNTYGKQKVTAEKTIKDNLDNWLIIRASHIYGWLPGGDNFVSWVMENLESGRDIEVSYDEFVTPIHVRNFVDILIGLLGKNKKGIYHVGEGECLSKYEFAKSIRETLQFNEAIIKPVSSEALNRNVVRPKNNCLDLSKINNELNLSQYSILNGLQKLKEKYDEYRRFSGRTCRT